ncbi:hypothetical protein BKA64DRAFT_686072 [Cadophora sp. MPI-SDFR-AT-0126]|nr:hypothetical protein BKA64DRAFT_686072 [Leotiomycetes sp. MPI-SDFR-AT-0126]
MSTVSDIPHFWLSNQKHPDSCPSGGGMYTSSFSIKALKIQEYWTANEQTVLLIHAVWHWNRYFGACVDSEAPLPQYGRPVFGASGLPDVKNLQRYFVYCDEVLDLKKDAIFKRIVEGVMYEDGHWMSRTRNGRVAKSKYE